MILLSPGLVVPFPPQLHSEKAQGRPFSPLGFPGADRAHRRAVTGALTTNNLSNRRCECFDLYKQIVPYTEAWSWQRSLVRRRRILVESDEDDSDTLIILQHPPVYTLGTNSSEKHLKFDMQDAPYDVYRTERGGEVTYHGPGQLVMYPIINLQYRKMDLHWYLRSLEEVIIRALSSTFSIKASRIEGLSGVWVGNQKVAAIGIQVSRWITYHGLALNVTTDLAPFRHIVPCGICDREVGSLRELLGRTSNEQTTEDGILMDVTRESLLREFAEVFQLSLEFRSISDLELLNKELDTLPMTNNF